jgi:hypothetical protein
VEHRRRLYLLTLFLIAFPVQARVYMTLPQALAGAFPAGAKVTRQTYFLTQQQLDDARRESGVPFTGQMIIRYMGVAGDKVLGYAYFDTHLVRTLPETVLIIVTPSGTIDRIDILSFDEPTEYFPKRRWIDQMLGRKLDSELSLNRAIRPLSGASLTAQAIVNASRKVLALHHVIK